MREEKPVVEGSKKEMTPSLVGRELSEGHTDFHLLGRTEKFGKVREEKKHHFCLLCWRHC